VDYCARDCPLRMGVLSPWRLFPEPLGPRARNLNRRRDLLREKGRWGNLFSQAHLRIELAALPTGCPSSAMGDREQDLSDPHVDGGLRSRRNTNGLEPQLERGPAGAISPRIAGPSPSSSPIDDRRAHAEDRHGRAAIPTPRSTKRSASSLAGHEARVTWAGRGAFTDRILRDGGRGPGG
jgi:hypothetical protein